MVIVLGSIVRDAIPYINRYLDQVDQLRTLLKEYGYTLIHVVTEGDSVDNTYEVLKQHSDIHVFKFDHKGDKFGSIDHPTRWQNIARTWNYMLDQLSIMTFDAFIYVEADLLWSTDTILQLLHHLDKVPAVAPMSMMGNIFYDTWGHRANGTHFTNGYPFHPALENWNGGLVQIDSAGSCKVMRGEVIRKCRLSEIDAMIGHDIYKYGYSLWLDPTIKVEHL